MPVNTEEIMNVLVQLAEHENLRVTVQESAKGACIVGGSAFAGGLLGGPVGLAVGGVVGSFVSLAYGRGKYRSVAEVIMYDMTYAQKTKLAETVQKAVRDIRPEDFVLLLPLVLNDAGLKQLLIKEVTKFIQNEMTVSISR